MSTTSQYMDQTVSRLNNPYQSLQSIIAELGGLQNPTKSEYTPAAKTAVTDPTILTLANYLANMGAQDYKYKTEDFQSVLDAATDAAYQQKLAEFMNAQNEYQRNQATQQATAQDAIRSANATAIQQGVAKGQQAANMLSAILATQQANAEGAQTLAQNRNEAANQYATDKAKNASTALDKSQAAMETLMGNIRQLYNDQIQQKTSELEYNASLEETLANYLANKYTADTNYAGGIISNAAGMRNTTQQALGGLGQAAIGGEAQDNYSAAYLQAQQALAAAQVEAARIAAEAAMASSRGSGGGGSSYTPAATSNRTTTAKTTTAGKTGTTKSNPAQGTSSTAYKNSGKTQSSTWQQAKLNRVR